MNAPSRRLHLPLGVRIWMAVVLALALLALLAGWVVQLSTDPPPREVVVRNAEGRVVGQGLRRAHPHERHVHASPSSGDGPEIDYPHGHFGSGPEFLVRMEDGETVHIHLPRPARPFWDRSPLSFVWMLGLMGIAAALALYPVVRRLTKRLEGLQQGVHRSHRAGQAQAASTVPGRRTVLDL